MASCYIPVSIFESHHLFSFLKNYTQVIYETPIQLYPNTLSLSGHFTKRVPIYDGLTIVVSSMKGEGHVSPIVAVSSPSTDSGFSREEKGGVGFHEGSLAASAFVERVWESGYLSLLAFQEN
jgi:hypothetical protein